MADKKTAAKASAKPAKAASGSAKGAAAKTAAGATKKAAKAASGGGASKAAGAATKTPPAKAAKPAVKSSAATTKAPAKVAPAKSAATKAPAKAAKAPAPAKSTPKAPAAKASPAAAAATAATSTKAPAARKAAPKAVDTKFYEEQRVLLLEEREEHGAQAERLKAEADQLVADAEPGDVQFDEESGEGGSLYLDRERDLVLAGQARQAVEEIDAALAKMALGTYGICESCQEPIPKARLKAIPHARLCVACKSGGLTRR